MLDFGTGERRYWLDLNRGAVPLRIEASRKAVTTHITIHENIQFVAGAGWLPLTQRSVMQNGKVARQMCITEVDAHLKPDLSAFQLDFQTPIKLYEDARKLRYSPRKTWRLLHLPGRDSPETRPAVPKSFVAPPGMPDEVTPGNAWPAILFALAAVLVAIAGVCVLKRTRRRIIGGYHSARARAHLAGYVPTTLYKAAISQNF
jgi:hypothetical protein